MSSFLTKLTPAERLFLLELSPTKSKDNSIFVQEECIDAQIAEKEIQLQKLRTMQSSKKKSTAVVDNSSGAQPQPSTGPRKLPGGTASIFPSKQRSASASRSVSVKPVSAQAPVNSKLSNAVEKSLLGKTNPPQMSTRPQISPNTSLLNDSQQSTRIDVSDLEDLSRRLAIVSRPFSDIESHLHRLDRLNSMIHVQTVNASEAPAEYLPPTRQFVSSDNQALQNSVGRLEDENAQLREEVVKLRSEAASRAKTEAERHSQREKIVQIQQRQLFGASRRIEWLLEERKQLVQKCDDRKSYIIKLERRLLDILGYSNAPGRSRDDGSARIASVPTSRKADGAVKQKHAGFEDFSISPRKDRPSVVMTSSVILDPSPTAKSRNREERMSLEGIDIEEIAAFTAQLQDTLQLSAMASDTKE
eukprot:ANDGO_03202.mRNA.1 hypothetical protein